MTIQIFGTMKCKDTQKAIRFFKERSITTQFVDLKVKSVSKGELNKISQRIPVQELIDTEGKQYRKRNLGYMKFDIEQELLDDPLLFRTPIVRSDMGVTLGYQPDIWKQWIEKLRE
ncbi:MAG: ArsC family transcriptional regulator [candidate division Zixibacteria bacterium]|nr:ArsC family transcriptional regulator [candidate division Zixibacteria bacterium]